MRKQLLIAAGGRGERIKSEKPKQFMHAGGLPLIVHVMHAFLCYDPDISIVAAIPREHTRLWQEICQTYGIGKHVVAEGGPARFHSVKNGLRHIDPSGLVAIHDGVRPLVSLKLIATVFDVAEKSGNAIPVITPFESVRQADHAMSNPLPREKVRLVQTPQCFHASRIMDAYNTHYDEAFTDDACVLERKGERLFLVEGDRENIKITTHSDLIMADALLKPF